MATIFRAPVFFGYSKKAPQPPDVWPNLLLSTLALAPAAPPLNGPIPDAQRLRSAAVQTDLVSMPLLLQQRPAQLLPPGSNGYDEWSQPRTVVRPQDTSAPASLLRISKPAQLLPIGSNGYDEWCTPKVAGRTQDTGSVNVLIQYPQIQASGTPFRVPVVSSWSKRITQPADSLPNLLTNTLSAQQQPTAPFKTADLLQIRSRIVFQDTNPVINVLANTLAPGPFIPADTSQQKVGARPQDTVAQNTLLRLPIGNVSPPVLSVDTTQRGRAAVWQDTQSANTLIRITTAGQIAPPVVPVDWVQRRAPVAPQDTQPSNLLIRILAPAQAVPPFGLDDWIQPRIRVVQQDSAVAPNLLLNTLSFPLPQVADDWTQVSVKRVHAQDTSNFNLVLRGIAPFVPTLIGNPRYIIQHLRARRWEVSSVSYLQFDPLDPAEAVELTFNFEPDLPDGVTLTGTPTVLYTLRGGLDSSPGTSVPNGQAGFNQASSRVIVPVKGTVDGNKYAIKVECTTTDPELRLALTGVLQMMEGA